MNLGKRIWVNTFHILMKIITVFPDVKRKIGKMMAFPRVGRGSSSDWLSEDSGEYGAKRTGGTGMWFGPRLGRVQKRNGGGENSPPWTYIIMNGEGLLPRQVHYTPRLGRESEELTEDDLEAAQQN